MQFAFNQSIDRAVKLFCLISLSHYVFQDLSFGVTADSAKEHEGLYYLEVVTRVDNSPIVGNSMSTSNINNFMLWHKRMGHLNFHHLQRLFPTLCRKLNYSEIRCEVCELAKHHLTSFPRAKNTHPPTFHNHSQWPLGAISYSKLYSNKMIHFLH